jgi:hypothetical protein
MAAPLIAGKLPRTPTPEGKGVVYAIKWAVQRSRYMTLETIASLSDNATVSLPAMDV